MVSFGDVGLLDEDNFLYIKDRKKILLFAVENIACLEVEAAQQSTLLSWKHLCLVSPMKAW